MHILLFFLLPLIFGCCEQAIRYESNIINIKKTCNVDTYYVPGAMRWFQLSPLGLAIIYQKWIKEFVSVKKVEPQEKWNMFHLFAHRATEEQNYVLIKELTNMFPQLLKEKDRLGYTPIQRARLALDVFDSKLIRKRVEKIVLLFK